MMEPQRNFGRRYEDELDESHYVLHRQNHQHQHQQQPAPAILPEFDDAASDVAGHSAVQSPDVVTASIPASSASSNSSSTGVDDDDVITTTAATAPETAASSSVFDRQRVRTGDASTSGRHDVRRRRTTRDTGRWSPDDGRTRRWRHRAGALAAVDSKVRSSEDEAEVDDVGRHARHRRDDVLTILYRRLLSGSGRSSTRRRSDDADDEPTMTTTTQTATHRRRTPSSTAYLDRLKRLIDTSGDVDDNDDDDDDFDEQAWIAQSDDETDDEGSERKDSSSSRQTEIEEDVADISARRRGGHAISAPAPVRNRLLHKKQLQQQQRRGHSSSLPPPVGDRWRYVGIDDGADRRSTTAEFRNVDAAPERDAMTSLEVVVTSSKRGFNDVVDLCVAHNCPGKSPGSLDYIRCLRQYRCT